MAIYHNRTQIIGRQIKDKEGVAIVGKDGKPLERSIVSKAAYRAGQNLRDERKEKIQPYQNRAAEVSHSQILAPEHAPDWLKTGQGGPGAQMDKTLRERLWNTIEKVEKRKDSQLAREFELALPRELSHEQQVTLVRQWCNDEIVSQGYVVDFALHRSKDGQNPHTHVLCTMRPVDPDAPLGFGKKPDMSGKFTGRGKVGAGAKADLADWRETWADAQNKALEAAGIDARVDHRSLEVQGVDRVPGRKIGVAASAMERKGVKTERGKLSRWAQMDNLSRHAIRTIELTGEVWQFGIGENWWERAQIAIGQTMTKIGELIQDESSGGRGLPDVSIASESPWQDYVQKRREPEPDRGIG